LFHILLYLIVTHGLEKLSLRLTDSLIEQTHVARILA
jgi:hypothetical protein